MTLDEIAALMQREGMVASREPAGPDEESASDGVITAALPSVDDEQIYGFEVAYLPDPSQQIEHARMLQISCVLAEDVAPERGPEVRALVARMNATALLPGFNLDQHGRVYFRHVALVPKAQSESMGESMGKVIIELVWLCHYFVDTFSEAVAAVVLGVADADAAWSRATDPGARDS